MIDVATYLVGALFFGILMGPVIVGFLVSMAIVGSGNRWQWAVLALPLFVGLCWLGLAIIRAAVTSQEIQGLLRTAVAYACAATLVPLAHAFRRWRAGTERN